MTTLRIEVPRVFVPLLAPARYKGAWGGRGSAKSWTFATNVIERCIMYPGTRVVCVREVQRSLEQSVKRLLEDTIKRYDVGSFFRVLYNDIETPGGGTIIFQGMQTHTAESIKSLEGFDVAWVEEAQVLSQYSLDLLRPTLRKAGSELWFTWNPRAETDPIDQFLRSKSAPSDAIVVHATYRDNPWFPEVLQREMEWDRGRDPEKFDHIWLGGYERHSEARVFKNWRVEEFDTPPNAAFLLGGDWGFATDPTVLVRGYIDGRRLYIDAEVYQVGCEIDETVALFDSLACTLDHRHRVLESVDDVQSSFCQKVARRWQIVADSARPETISYVQRHGYPRIIAAKKGAHSVEEGIQFLKTYDIIVHPRCQHAIDEFTNYRYKQHPLTNIIMPVLEDKKNHVIDAIRYMVEPLRMPVQDGSLTW